MVKKDNSTIRSKILLRTNLLKLIDDPVIMETHGGNGRIWLRCYSHISKGVVFEKNPAKVATLARQRPTWSVYECDCERAIAQGAGAHLEVNFLDLDPYGEPWPVIDAFFASDRPRAKVLAVAVNDGLRQKVKMGGAWRVESLRAVVRSYGNTRLYANYLDVCRELLEQKASQAGYHLTRWGGHYCGHSQQMTHYGALLTL